VLPERQLVVLQIRDASARSSEAGQATGEFERWRRPKAFFCAQVNPAYSVDN
jgi:hypothetical protein